MSHFPPVHPSGGTPKRIGEPPAPDAPHGQRRAGLPEPTSCMRRPASHDRSAATTRLYQTAAALLAEYRGEL
ncbi:MAG: hypothetical protein ACYDH5_06610 [Acidimicrobiales bacterium]